MTVDQRVLELLVSARLVDIDKRSECLRMVAMLDEAIAMLRAKT